MPPAPTSWPPSLPPSNTPISSQLEALNIGSSTEQQHWYMDTAASSHLASDACILNSVFNYCNYFPTHVITGNGSTLPVSTVGNTSLPHTSLRLSNTLIAPSIVKNLVSVRRFTRDNSYSFEFNPFDFSVKDLKTKTEILRYNSDGDLYPFIPSPAVSSPAHALSVAVPFSFHSLWRRRLGHPGHQVLSTHRYVLY